MTAIPLPTGARGDTRTPKQIEVLRNCYFEVDDVGTINTRPAARLVTNGIGRCRGQGLFKDELYQVSNDRLIKITLDDSTLPPTEDNVIIDNIGEIDGLEDCVLVSSFSQLVIMVIGGATYTYNESDGLREITDPLFSVSVSVTFNNGNFVFIPLSGDPFIFCSDANLLADPASANFEFADAELFTDPNKSVISRRNQIYVGGARSVERLGFNETLNTYQTIEGASTQYGYVGGLTDYGDTFMFIGQGANGGFSFFMMQNLAVPLQNKFIDEILNTYSLTELENIRGEHFRWFNQDIAVFYLPNHTIAYYGDFALWNSGNLQDTWTVSFMQTAYGYIWTGDQVSSNIGILTEDNSEYGMKIEGELQTFARGEPRQDMMVSRIFCQCNTGIETDNYNIGLSVSRDGKIFGNTIYQTLGENADYMREVSWGPIGNCFGFLAMRLRWYGNVRLAIDGMHIQ